MISHPKPQSQTGGKKAVSHIGQVVARGTHHKTPKQPKNNKPLDPYGV
jgi:hypothetical protein